MFAQKNLEQTFRQETTAVANTMWLFNFGSGSDFLAKLFHKEVFGLFFFHLRAPLGTS